MNWLRCIFKQVLIIDDMVKCTAYSHTVLPVYWPMLTWLSHSFHNLSSSHQDFTQTYPVSACSITRSLDRPIQTLLKQCKTWQPCSMNMLTAERPHTGSWQYSHQVKLMCPVVAKRFSMSHTHSDTGCIIQMPTGLLLLQGGLTLLHCYC